METGIGIKPENLAEVAVLAEEAFKSESMALDLATAADLMKCLAGADRPGAICQHVARAISWHHRE